MEKKINVKQLTLCGVLAALVFVLTYFPKVPVPVTGGYVHLGDGAIFLAALLLGPLGIPAAAIGSGLADLIGGYMLYVIPTVIIKGLVALVAMMPLITVQVMGLIYVIKTRRAGKASQLPDYGDTDVIELWEV